MTEEEIEIEYDKILVELYIKQRKEALRLTRNPEYEYPDYELWKKLRIASKEKSQPRKLSTGVN